MIIKNKFTGKESEVSYYTWERNPAYKVNSIVVNWGDIVFAQQITPKNKLIDLYIMDRDQACGMIENNPNIFAYRELTHKERKDLIRPTSDPLARHEQLFNKAADLLPFLEDHPIIRWILLLAALVGLVSGILVFFI